MKSGKQMDSKEWQQWYAVAKGMGKSLDKIFRQSSDESQYKLFQQVIQHEKNFEKFWNLQSPTPQETALLFKLRNILYNDFVCNNVLFTRNKKRKTTHHQHQRRHLYEDDEEDDKELICTLEADEQLMKQEVASPVETEFYNHLETFQQSKMVSFLNQNWEKISAFLASPTSVASAIPTAAAVAAEAAKILSPSVSTPPTTAVSTPTPATTTSTSAAAAADDKHYESSSGAEEDKKKRKSKKSKKEDKPWKQHTKTENKLLDKLYTEMYQSWKKVNEKEEAWPFRKAVTKKEAEDYYDVIKHPMDLSKILKNIKACAYQSKQQFVSDFELMFSNCREYNTDERSIYRKCCDSLEAFCHQSFQSIPNVNLLEQQQQHQPQQQQQQPQPMFTDSSPSSGASSTNTPSSPSILSTTLSAAPTAASSDLTFTAQNNSALTNVYRNLYLIMFMAKNEIELSNEEKKMVDKYLEKQREILDKVEKTDPTDKDRIYHLVTLLDRFPILKQRHSESQKPFGEREALVRTEDEMFCYQLLTIILKHYNYYYPIMSSSFEPESLFHTPPPSSTTTAAVTSTSNQQQHQQPEVAVQSILIKNNYEMLQNIFKLNDLRNFKRSIVTKTYEQYQYPQYQYQLNEIASASSSSAGGASINRGEIMNNSESNRLILSGIINMYAQHQGFESSYLEPVEVLTEVMESYIMKIGKLINVFHTHNQLSLNDSLIKTLNHLKLNDLNALRSSQTKLVQQSFANLNLVEKTLLHKIKNNKSNNYYGARGKSSNPFEMHNLQQYPPVIHQGISGDSSSLDDYDDVDFNEDQYIKTEDDDKHGGDAGMSGPGGDDYEDDEDMVGGASGSGGADDALLFDDEHNQGHNSAVHDNDEEDDDGGLHGHDHDDIIGTLTGGGGIEALGIRIPEGRHSTFNIGGGVESISSLHNPTTSTYSTRSNVLGTKRKRDEFMNNDLFDYQANTDFGSITAPEATEPTSATTDRAAEQSQAMEESNTTSSSSQGIKGTKSAAVATTEKIETPLPSKAPAAASHIKEEKEEPKSTKKKSSATPKKSKKKEESASNSEVESTPKKRGRPSKKSKSKKKE